MSDAYVTILIDGVECVFDSDFPFLNSRRMELDPAGYVSINGVRGIHRLIANPAKGEVVDHINGIRTDNRRCNLRCVTQAQNAANRKSRGYCWDKRSGKWVTQVFWRGKQLSQRRFAVEAEAAEYAMELKRKYKGADYRGGLG